MGCVAYPVGWCYYEMPLFAAECPASVPRIFHRKSPKSILQNTPKIRRFKLLPQGLMIHEMTLTAGKVTGSRVSSPPSTTTWRQPMENAVSFL